MSEEFLPDAPATPIVGLGASAGGLDAFTRLVAHLPPDSGLAFVVVQHLAPDHESLLPALLGRATTIPVVQAEDGMRIVRDHTYVIPPNMTMTVTDGHLRLAARSRRRGPHLPIDAFLCSLAEVHGPGAIGVILSGAGSDGARGIEAVKEAGGITFAQESSSARFSSMPEAAVSTGAVDFVLTPQEIGEQLGRLGRHLTAADRTENANDESAADALRQILQLLHRRTGVDFEHYRRGTVHRRILRRMLVHQRETRSDYLAHVRLDPAELDLLYEDLLIGVTSFFRDPDVFTTLRETGLPVLMESRPPDAPIRAWIAGCAGGEETYSLAILLLEYLEERGLRLPIQLFGTDLSERAVARARAGWYPRSIEAQVSPERLRRFFVAEEGGYRIAKAVRERCVFSRQNIVRDPPFSHLDLISCRNVLIYLDTPLQRRVFPIFHYALEPHGLLMLGTAESTGVASDLFAPLAKRHKIFRRVAAPVRPLDIDFTVPAASGRGPGAATLPWRRALPHIPLPDASSRDDVAAGGDRVLLARFVPPGVIVDEQREILHFRGDTSAFLTHAPGVATLDLLALARPELVMPLRSALSRATASGEPVSEDRVMLVDGGARREVTVEVIPFRPASSAQQCFAVTFIESPRAPEPGADAPRTAAGKASSRRTMRRSETDADSAPELARARDELSATRRYLQDVIEQHSATIEELRAASEEIQSSNEELQSTNEELETTKEEVQSANEELTTLNDELLHRNRELAALSADLSNVLSSTTIPIAIVDSDLRLRRFTPALTRVMRVIPTDAGRPLGDIRLRFSLPDLDQIIARTIETLTVIEHDVQDEDGSWWTMTVRPYQTLDRHVDGAVLVFGDIDTAKRAGDRSEKTSVERGRLLAVSEAARDTAEQARRRAEQANEAKATFLASMSHDLRTPLNAITGYVNLLELGVRGSVNESQLLDLGRIKGNARHLLAIINDILNFARVEAGQLDLRPTVLSLPTLLDELESLVAPQLALKGVHFERGEAHGAAYADAERVQQVLVNLLTNAIKFTPAAGRITVTGAVDEDRAEITVSDTGVGIPLDELERIFEPFVQVGRGLTTPPPDGVGLGLAISRDLARAMHGDLTVTSVVGEGSTFVLTLPRA